MDAEPASNGTAAVLVEPPALRLNDHLAEAVKLEHQLVKVPYEHLKKSMRATTRFVEKEVNAVVAGVAEAVDKDMSNDETVQHLTSLVSRLQGLKRKLDESNKSEQGQVQRCRARLDHLSILSLNSKETQAKWNSVRVDRILVDYMLRSYYYDTAMKLAESANIQDLTNIDIFLDARKVVDALRNRDCSEALAWCTDNKSKLKKAKSKFEFKLRLQEFIELVRAEKMMDAIMYARKYLAAWGNTNMKELQQAMATLAFKSNTDCASYKAGYRKKLLEKNALVGANQAVPTEPGASRPCPTCADVGGMSCNSILFDVRQWDNLIHQFKQEFCKLYGMTLEPLLKIHLQAGLSALKTPFCYEVECTKEDPLSQATLRQLAEPLPFAKHIHSKLVCFISKELMNEDNPPLVLPNGFVYSRKSLEDMAKKNQGKVTCPRTGDMCNFTELSKAYIS